IWSAARPASRPLVRLEDATDIDTDLAVRIRKAYPITHQPAGLAILAQRIDRWDKHNTDHSTRMIGGSPSFLERGRAVRRRESRMSLRRSEAKGPPPPKIRRRSIDQWCLTKFL